MQKELKPSGPVDYWSGQRELFGKIAVESLPIPRSLVPRTDLRSSLRFVKPLEGSLILFKPQETQLQALPAIKVRASSLIPVQESLRDIFPKVEVPGALLPLEGRVTALEPLKEPVMALLPSEYGAQSLVPYNESLMALIPLEDVPMELVVSKPSSMALIPREPRSRAVQPVAMPSGVQKSMQQSARSLVPRVPTRSALTVQTQKISSARIPSVREIPVSREIFQAEMQPHRQETARSLVPRISEPSALITLPSAPVVQPAITPAEKVLQGVSLVKEKALVPFVPKASALTVPSDYGALVPMQKGAVQPGAMTLPEMPGLSKVQAVRPTFQIQQPSKIIGVSDQATQSMRSKFDPRTLLATIVSRKKALPVTKPEIKSIAGVPTAQEILAGVGERPLVEGYPLVPLNDTEVTFLGNILNSLSKIARNARGQLAPVTIPDVAIKKVLDLGKKHDLVFAWVHQDCLSPDLILEGASSTLTDAQGNQLAVLGHTSAAGYLPMAVRRDLLVQFSGAIKARVLLDTDETAKRLGEEKQICIQPLIVIDQVKQQAQLFVGENWLDRSVAGLQQHMALIVPQWIQDWLKKNHEKIAALKKEYPLLEVKEIKKTVTEKDIDLEKDRLLILAKVRSETLVEKSLVTSWMKKGGPKPLLAAAAGPGYAKQKMQNAYDLFDGYNGLLQLLPTDGKARESLERLKLTIFTVLGEDNDPKGIRDRLFFVKWLRRPTLSYVR